MSQLIFVDLDSVIGIANMEIDNILDTTSSKEIIRALNIIKERLVETTVYISQIQEEYNRLEGNNKKLQKAMQAACRQMNDLELDND